MNNFDQALQAQILADSRTPYSLAKELMEEKAKNKALQDKLDDILNPKKSVHPHS